ncbi:hypothetical protein BofuT4_P018740.1 [Botrytis cinerea T4]|uniref:Uncharacterized protein n=1 Tax=Botryotinia fuckeliana (strain T4) TaxID=999810 RepID=G2YIN1_BOTF4|nr:hypothetical protein BofuT4_P018740.1 [Botrytis cinerea T4]
MVIIGFVFYAIAIFGVWRLSSLYTELSRPILAVLKYHNAHRSSREEELPPVYPSPMPSLGNALSLAWGSRLVRYLQQVLHIERGTHDDDAMSLHDLALHWASNANAVSAAAVFLVIY